MVLTDKELQEIRQVLESLAGYDEELMRRCGHLIHLGAFDEAVRSAFVLLEERLREAVHEERMTGTQLANHAFAFPDGPLSKYLGRTKSEREGLRELFSGSFKLFRNPSAHGAVGYDHADGKAIIGLVNLMLNLVKRAGELPPVDFFPENVENGIKFHEGKLGAGGASRLRLFLGQCLKKGMKPVPTSKQLIPFKRHAMVKFESWEKPRPHSVAVFYLSGDNSEKGIYIPIEYYYSSVVGFNSDRYIDDFLELGFRRLGNKQELYVDLRMYNDEGFFKSLFALIARIDEALEETLIG